MRIRALADAHRVFQEAAALTAAEARAAVAARGRFVMAISRHTPWELLRMLAREDLPWSHVHIVQVDECAPPAGDPDRASLRGRVLVHCPVHPERVHPMPVEDTDLDAASARYVRVLQEIAGVRPVLDLVHLGLGADGHAASLVPGDPVLEMRSVDVAPTQIHHGRRRLTLTYPALDRARRIVWLVLGRDRSEMLMRLCAGDRSIPAGRVNQNRAVVLADHEAAARLRPAPPLRY